MSEWKFRIELKPNKSNPKVEGVFGQVKSHGTQSFETNTVQ